MLGWSGVPVSQGRVRAVGAFTRAVGDGDALPFAGGVVPADFGPAVMVCRAMKSYPPWVLSRMPVLGAQEWLVRRAGGSSLTCVFQPIWRQVFATPPMPPSSSDPYGGRQARDRPRRPPGINCGAGLKVALSRGGLSDR